MKIELDTPFSVGDLAPEQSYPDVYITTFYVNGPAALVEVAYEVGKLTDPSEDNPMGSWSKSPYVPSGTVTIAGQDLFPFFLSKPENTSTPLWDQVEVLLYKEIQKKDERLAGKLV